MARKSKQPECQPVIALRTIARRFPEVDEGTTCNKTAYKARNKAFLFVGQADDTYNVMLKLADSLVDAEKLAVKQPHQYKVGSGGWVTLVFPHDEFPASGLMQRWIDESYRLLVHKQLVAMLPEKGAVPQRLATKKAVTKKLLTKATAKPTIKNAKAKKQVRSR